MNLSPEKRARISKLLRDEPRFTVRVISEKAEEGGLEILEDISRVVFGFMPYEDKLQIAKDALKWHDGEIS